MKTSMRKTMSVSTWIRVGSFGIVVAVASVVVLPMGCSNTAEGDPCDIALSHDECAGQPTAVCTIPTNCAGPVPTDGSWYDPRATGNAYCCSPNSTAPNCQPCMTAPPGEGGADDASAPGEDAPAPDAPAETGSLETGPKETGPAESGPLESGPAETGPTDTGFTETSTG